MERGDFIEQGLAPIMWKGLMSRTKPPLLIVSDT
jgi:hypothetical protein